MSFLSCRGSRQQTLKSALLGGPLKGKTEGEEIGKGHFARDCQECHAGRALLICDIWHNGLVEISFRSGMRRQYGVRFSSN
jgi:hypothetical protein